MLGTAWRVGLGSSGETIGFTIRRPWPDLAVVDLDAVQSVLVTIVRLSNHATVQSDLATIVDGPAGTASLVLNEVVANDAGHLTVSARVDHGDGEVSVHDLGRLLVEGRDVAGQSTLLPPGAEAEETIIYVDQWTPEGDLVVELHRLDEALAPTGDPSYLWDDPTDSTDSLVAWPGDPDTLLDVQP